MNSSGQQISCTIGMQNICIARQPGLLPHGMLWEEAHEGHQHQLGNFIDGTSQPICEDSHKQVQLVHTCMSPG